jgi:hypothetical protein
MVVIYADTSPEEKEVIYQTNLSKNKYNNRKAEIACNTRLIQRTNITWSILQINQTRG